MTYFKRIEDYQTYSNEKADFHFNYNANSGNGQAFLGGSYYDAEGKSHRPKELEGKLACLFFAYHDIAGTQQTVNLGTNTDTLYPIIPRANGNNQMKLLIEERERRIRRLRPSLIFSSLLMLPETCGVNRAESLTVSPLTPNNYWLRSMWLECTVHDKNVMLIPKDYVFSGGQSRASNNKVIGKAQFFLLDFNRRANDIIYAANHSTFLPVTIRQPVQQLSAVLTSKEPFSHGICRKCTNEIMQNLSHERPEIYSGYSDPLPAIMKILQNAKIELMKSRNHIEHSHNWIFFGAPGTGKSHELNRIAKKSFPEENISRVTFYPDYTYSQFVGCFKPITEKTAESTSHITYRYVLGPFLKTYVEACKHPDQNYLLIVEEINRANPAAVFGDIFQLLDRREDGCSDYSIVTPEEMRDQLTEEFKDEQIDADKLAIPSNMYIWATMNSADQGVFPMDTAFKRRWDFHYIGIDEGENATVEVKNGDVEEEKQLSEIDIPCCGHLINWNAFRKAINNFMMSDNLKVNEDKLLGPFFINPSALNEKRFTNAFKDKVILYLYEDACKTKRQKMFRNDLKTYAQICEAFNENPVGIFVESFSSDGNADAIYVNSEADNQGEAAEQ